MNLTTSILFYALAFLMVIHCNGEFIITHSPKHVNFRQTGGSIMMSEILKAVSLAMGFTPLSDLSWDGLSSSSMFKRPKANVMFAIETSQPLKPRHLFSYDIKNVDSLVQLESLVNNIQESFMEFDPLIVDLSAGKTVFDLKAAYKKLFSDVPATMEQVLPHLQKTGSILTKYNTGTLNMTHNDELSLLAELQIIEEIMTTLENNPSLSQDNVPDVYNFEIAGLNAIINRYGQNSQQASDGVTLLEEFLEKMTTRLRKLYNDNIMIEVVTFAAPSSGVLSRKSRSLMAATAKPTTGPDTVNLNLAPEYAEDYPVVFNIILWTMIFIALAVYGVSLGLWNMDPGRDSIIYRMTSQRMKKD